MVHLSYWKENKKSILSQESLGWEPFVMMMQTGEYWLTDNRSLFLRRIPVWKAIPFSCYLFQDGGRIGWAYNIIYFQILRLPDLPKNIPVFWKLSCIALRTKTSLPGGQVRSKADNRFWLVFLMLSAAILSNRSPYSLRSLSLSSLSFFTPPLFLRSTGFPSGCRLVFRLNLKTPNHFHLSLFGQGAEESKKENRCGWDTGKRLIRSVSSGGGLHLHLSFSRWWRER